jgi:hypothetical protein
LGGQGVAEVVEIVFDGVAFTGQAEPLGQFGFGV